jgi:hypothetical protein
VPDAAGTWWCYTLPTPGASAAAVASAPAQAVEGAWPPICT